MSEIRNYGKSIRARLLNVAKQEDVYSLKVVFHFPMSLVGFKML